MILPGNHFLAGVFSPQCGTNPGTFVIFGTTDFDIRPSLLCGREAVWRKARLFSAGCLTQAASFHLVGPYRNGNPHPVLNPKTNYQTPDAFNGTHPRSYTCLGVDGAEEAGEPLVAGRALHLQVAFGRA